MAAFAVAVTFGIRVGRPRPLGRRGRVDAVNNFRCIRRSFRDVSRTFASSIRRLCGTMSVDGRET